MKKILITFLFILSTSGSVHAASANPQKVVYHVMQGSTLEVRLPASNILQVEGQFDGAAVPFYKIFQQPEYDDPISRGEFLELLFVNWDNAPDDPSLIEDNASAFPDLDASHPFFQSIHRAARLNIIHGYENGDFGPYDPITRGQIAKILVNTFKPSRSPGPKTSFPDVAVEHVFAQEIEDAVAADYFSGYPDGLMRPDRSINFSEAETVIWRATDRDVLQTIGERPFWRAFIGIHRLSDVETKDLEIKKTFLDNHTEFEHRQVNILKREFDTVSFTLPESKTKLFGKTEQDNTWAMINEAKSSPSAEQLWEEEFIVPTEGTPTLGFGDQLYINGSYSGSHFGHDWGNSEGTEIFASNTGLVTLSDWTQSYGNTVIIDHGHNVFTMYLHLSELKTKLGDAVQKGDLIGLMGSTGIATGSHLHFTHFIGSIIVDSDEWFSLD